MRQKKKGLNIKNLLLEQLDKVNLLWVLPKCIKGGVRGVYFTKRYKNNISNT